MPIFPSTEWMQAYAETVAAHPRADVICTALAGRFRFVITPDKTFRDTQTHDLLVEPPGSVRAEPPAQDAHLLLTVTASYGRWRGLISGKADLMMSFLLRRIRVDGDLGLLRERAGDARLLLDCLGQVPTTYID